MFKPNVYKKKRLLLYVIFLPLTWYEQENWSDVCVVVLKEHTGFVCVCDLEEILEPSPFHFSLTGWYTHLLFNALSNISYRHDRKLLFLRGAT
jgi:hypothetical protein